MAGRFPVNDRIVIARRTSVIVASLTGISWAVVIGWRTLRMRVARTADDRAVSRRRTDRIRRFGVVVVARSRRVDRTRRRH